jgi:acid phosphatase
VALTLLIGFFMKIRKSTALLLVAPLVGLVHFACSSNPSPSDSASAPKEGDGAVGLALQAAPGITLSTVSYTITGPGNFSKSGTIDVSNSTMLTATIAGLPAGNGYNITVTGTSTDGATNCLGSAMFNVVAHQTGGVSVHLTCHEAPRTGAALVNGNLNICPQIDGIDANPAEVVTGGSIALNVQAHDSDHAPSALSYQWSGPIGTLSDTTSASPTFTCNTVGPVTLSVTVSDGDTTMGCADTSSVTVNCSPGPLQNDVQNIVFIYAENRSFDGLFGNFPGAHGLSDVVDAMGAPLPAYIAQKDRDGTTPLTKLPQTWNGATAGGNPTVITQAQTDNLSNAPFPLETGFTAFGGPTATLTTLDVTRDMAHRFFENMMEINGGTNDMFAAWLDAGGITMGHFDYSKSSMYALAQQNVLADNFFEGAFGGSFLNHQYLICACAPSVPTSYIMSNNPSVNVLATMPNAKGVPQLATNASSPSSALAGPPSFKTGNIAPLDYFGAGDGYRAVNTMQPAYQPSGNFPATGAMSLAFANPAAATTLPPQTQTTVGDLLTAKGVDWAWYATSWDAAVMDGMQPAGSTHAVIYTPSTPRGNPDFQAHHHPFNYTPRSIRRCTQRTERRTSRATTPWWARSPRERCRPSCSTSRPAM